MDTQNKVVKKRQRSENWLDEDKHLLMDLVKERVSMIENKNTDTNTNSKKIAAWADLLNSFNSMCKGGIRNFSQLKAQWGIIKMTQKKLKSEERKYILKTGGGPPPQLDPENSDDISSWLPNEFTIDMNEFDSDNINQIKVGEPLPANNEVKVDDITNVSTSAAKQVTSYILQEVQNTPEIITHSPYHMSSGVKRSSASYKETPKKSKRENTSCEAATERIAQTEIECRKEIHQLHMENEIKKARNLDLEEILLKKKN